MATTQCPVNNEQRMQQSRKLKEQKQTKKQSQFRAVLTDISNQSNNKGVADKPQVPPLVRKEENSKKRSIPLLPLNKTTCTKAKEIVTNPHKGESTEKCQGIHIEDYLICGEYVADIYGYLIEQQEPYQVSPDYFKSQSIINSKMRMVLVDWLLQVHYKFKLEQESLFLTVSIIDRYMSSTDIDKSKLQLIGITAMLIASKYEDVYPPTISDLVYMTADSYTEDNVKELEKIVLKALDYRLGETSALVFLRRISRLAKVTPEVHSMGKFLVEIMLYDHAFLAYPPTHRAATAYYTTIQLITSQKWSPSHERLCGYTIDQLQPCVRRLTQRLTRILAQKDYRAAVDKYSSSRFLRVSKHPSLQGDAMKRMAQ